MNRKGQTAMVDSLVFLALMGIATAIILADVPVEDVEYQELQYYSRDFAETLLSVDILQNGTGEDICTLLCEATVLKMNGGDTSEIEEQILNAGISLIRPGASFAISSGSIEQDFFMSDHAEGPGDLPGEVAALSRQLVFNGLQIEIIVYVWWSS